MSFAPFSICVLFIVAGTLLINSVDNLLNVSFLNVIVVHNLSNSLFHRGIDENIDYVVIILKNIVRASSNNYATFCFSKSTDYAKGFEDDLLGNWKT